MDDNAAKAKGKPKTDRPWGFAFMPWVLLLVIAVICLAPSILATFPERFLPPHCDEALFASIIANPPTKMRVIKDVFSRTQVIAVDEEDRDICFFKATTEPNSGIISAEISPNGQRIAFTSKQTISENSRIHHLFLVNSLDGSYLRFAPDNPEEIYAYLVWSPDGQTLAFNSHSNCCISSPSHVFISLLSSEGDLLWRLDIGDAGQYRLGALSWSETGEQIIYDSGEMLVVPYRCSVNQDGSNLRCEELGE
jgi:WD40 repeat protein